MALTGTSSSFPRAGGDRSYVGAPRPGSPAFGTPPSGAVATTKGGVYALVDPNTGEVVRTGRTNDFSRRQKEHYRDPTLQQYDFERLYYTDDKRTQRGLEQYVHEQYNPRLNKIAPVAWNNRRAPVYRNAAMGFLQNLLNGMAGP